MRQQFCGQNASYRANYPDARFEIVEHDGAPIGRIVTARMPDAVLIVDIALIASSRRRGIGASLVNGVLKEARAADLPVRLSVVANNAAALRFYLRLGFRPIASSAIDTRLEWRNPCHKEGRVDGSRSPCAAAWGCLGSNWYDCAQHHAAKGAPRSAANSASLNTRPRVKNRTPSGASTEKPAPRPGTTSMMSCVWRHSSNWAAPI
jgi:N-acetylglutamate synthase-like GNAT family acetyltransferase